MYKSEREKVKREGITIRRKEGERKSEEMAINRNREKSVYLN